MSRRSIEDDRSLTLLGGLGLGMAAMYLLDPDRGARRRAELRDRLRSAAASLGEAIDVTRRDVGNRARGLASEARSRLVPEDVGDDVLVGRVRAGLGRVVSHPRSIIATARDGIVTLSGPILASEVDRLLETVRGVRGVHDVVNQLEVHEHGDHVPGLQGGEPRTGEAFELRQEHWSPSARLLVGAAGGALALTGLQRRDGLGALLGLAGVALFARSATNTEMGRLVGVGGHGMVDVEKTITIGAPVSEVFAFFSRWENFPQFMRHVREVRDIGDGRSHWRVDGPANVPVEWEATVTRLELDDVLEWESVPGSTITSSGAIRFVPTDDGATRVHIRMSYEPPAGVVGHAVSRMFGRDPRTQMEEDLVRVKTFLETGIAAHDAARSLR